jgi:hypothetical protein
VGSRTLCTIGASAVMLGAMSPGAGAAVNDGAIMYVASAPPCGWGLAQMRKVGDTIDISADSGACQRDGMGIWVNLRGPNGIHASSFKPNRGGAAVRVSARLAVRPGTWTGCASHATSLWALVPGNKVCFTNSFK